MPHQPECHGPNGCIVTGERVKPMPPPMQQIEKGAGARFSGVLRTWHFWHRIWRSPRSSNMRYMVVRPPVSSEIGKIGELLSYLAADRGYEVIGMVAHHDGTTEYLMARRD